MAITTISYKIPPPHIPITDRTSGFSIAVTTNAPRLVLKSVTFNSIISNSTITVDGQLVSVEAKVKLSNSKLSTEEKYISYSSATDLTFDFLESGYEIGSECSSKSVTIGLNLVGYTHETYHTYVSSKIGLPHGLGKVSSGEKVAQGIGGLYTTTTSNIPEFSLSYEYDPTWKENNNINDGYVYIPGLATERPRMLNSVWYQSDLINDGYVYIPGLATERPVIKNRSNWYYNGKNCVLYLNGKEVSTFYNGKG